MAFTPAQVWRLATKKGPRYYYWSHEARRAIPFPGAEAELLIATGRTELVDKPSWVGAK